MGRTYRVHHLKMNRCEGILVNPQIGHYAFVPEMNFIAGYFPTSRDFSRGIITTGENIEKARLLLGDKIYAGERAAKEIRQSPDAFPFLIDTNEGIAVLNNGYARDENGEPLGIESCYVVDSEISQMGKFFANFPVKLKKPFDSTLNGLLDILSTENLTFKTRVRLFLERRF